ncbi:MAG: DNA/RNA nuclease SfsA [Candidatus Bathyarchaeia archaeon]
MKLGSSIITATYAERPNRFTVIAHHNSSRVRCYFPNPGRMNELLIPGAEMALDGIDRFSNHTRKTTYEVIAVRLGKRWISIDSRIPNKLVAEALRNKQLKEFQSYTQIKQEAFFGKNRFDFLLESPNQSCWLEVKSCTLVVNGVAIFPDAPTARGSRHLRGLTEAKKRGYRACIMFVIQREDAKLLTPNLQTDPVFCDSLRAARRSGVEVYAKRCKFSNFNLTLDDNVPVKF